MYPCAVFHVITSFEAVHIPLGVPVLSAPSSQRRKLRPRCFYHDQEAVQESSGSRFLALPVPGQSLSAEPAGKTENHSVEILSGVTDSKVILVGSAVEGAE